MNGDLLISKNMVVFSSFFPPSFIEEEGELVDLHNETELKEDWQILEKFTIVKKGVIY